MMCCTLSSANTIAARQCTALPSLPPYQKSRLKWRKNVFLRNPRCRPFKMKKISSASTLKHWPSINATSDPPYFSLDHTFKDQTVVFNRPYSQIFNGCRQNPIIQQLFEKNTFFLIYFLEVCLNSGTMLC
jgi:hypothetical protein